jgi:VWFA-related protein
MSGLTLAAFLLAQTTSLAPGTQVRVLTVSFVDEKGAEVTNLAAKDVAVVENGLTRDITSFKPDARPLAVAILLDSSAAVADSYRLNLVDAVSGLIARFPEGTRYAIWTTGDRPTKIVGPTSDQGAAGGALRRVVPQGGNTMLDTLAEASSDLAKLAREGERTLLVAITGTGPELSSRDKQRSVEETAESGVWVLAVEIDGGEGDLEARMSLGYVLDRLAAATGGRSDVVLSPMAVDDALRKLSAVVRGSYRLAYATTADLKKRKLRVDVARPGTRVLVPAASAQEP